MLKGINKALKEYMFETELTGQKMDTVEEHSCRALHTWQCSTKDAVQLGSSAARQCAGSGVDLTVHTLTTASSGSCACLVWCTNVSKGSIQHEV